MSKTTEDQFHKASDFLPNLVKKIDKSILLKFYGLYKQASVGECNIDKPAWFNMEAKAKYSAWYSLGKMSKEEAMLKYIDLLNETEPGWEQQIEEINWSENDRNDHTANNQHDDLSKGWVNVSCMVNDEKEMKDDDKNIFEWTKEGNVDKVMQSIEKTKDFDVDHLDENGLNCLHWACDRGHLKVVQYLVETCGANVNSKDSEGETPLDYANTIEHKELINYLKKKGAL